MVVKSYEQMTDVSIMEVKTYLLIHSDGIYQQDIYDLMNTCIDVFQLKRKLNKRKVEMASVITIGRSCGVTMQKANL